MSVRKPFIQPVLSIHRVTTVRSVVMLIAAAGLSALGGCARSRPAAVKPVAAFNPNGRWRSQQPGLTLSVRLLPDGTLDMVDPRGRHHPFHRVGQDRWEARISRVNEASIERQGDQLVFRTRPTAESGKPVTQKNGMVVAMKSKPHEDRMTRIPDK